MTALDQSIHEAVLSFLKRSGMSGRRFGREALGDPGFVASLGAGRRLGLNTADRVLEFMGEPPVGPAFRREVEAFLRLCGAKPYLFGEAAAGDPSFVERLRRGVSFRLVTVDKVRAFMGAEADAACLAAMHEAVAGVALLARGGSDCEQRGETTMNNDESPYVSARRAAARLGLSARTLYRLRESGAGPDYYRFGHRILYRIDALERWAAEHLVRSSPRPGPAPGREDRAGRGEATLRAVAAVAVLAATAALGLGADPAFAASDTTFSGPLDTVRGMVSGTGGQLAAALAVGAALVGSVLRFNAMQLLGAVGVGVAAGAGVGIVTGLVGTAIV